MFTIENLHSTLCTLAVQGPILVAYSGGLDSHVLLHSLWRVRRDYPELMLKVRAIHINHGLSQNAERWSRHCQQVCERLEVECMVTVLDLHLCLPLTNLEATARELRYQAFAALMRPKENLMTAHTEDDQAETLLLQLLRGAGVKGLSAMPVQKEFAAGVLIRPLLRMTRADICDYAEREQLVWVEDESNALTHFNRNYLRHQVLPVLEVRWPGVRQVLVRSAAHCAEASALLDELAQHDLSSVQDTLSKSLSVVALRALSVARQRNVLRFWFRSMKLKPPTAVQLQRIQNDFLYSHVDAEPRLLCSGVEIRRYHHHLWLLPSLPAFKPGDFIPWDGQQPLCLPMGLGTLTMQEVKGQGFYVANVTTMMIGFRQGGERFHPVERIGSHPLKKLFQEWRVPPWLRDRIPLIYSQGQLVCVVGYAVSQQHAANDNRRGKVILVE